MSIPLIEAALACVKLGWWVFPLGEKSKVTDATLAPHSHKSASNDPEQITKWWTASPNANVGIDLGRSNLTVLDFDNGEPPAELNLNGALRVKTARGTHVYFSGINKQGKMYFNGQPVGDIKSEGGYVLAPPSVHPDGPVYTVAGGKDLAPLAAATLERLRPAEKGPVDASPNGEKIPRGQHDTTLFKIACKLRGVGLEEKAILEAVIEVCEKRCENYGSDYHEMCEKVTRQAMGYKPGNSDTAIELNQTTAAAPAASAEDVEPEIEDSQIAVRPRFPHWVMAGTSLMKGLVEPACENSSKYPELVFVPAVQLYLNALALHVKLKSTPRMVPNMFVGVIAPYGQYFKSTCCELGHEYFQMMGVARPLSRDVKNAEGRIVITNIGSTEGLGKAMHNANGKKCILYYDELGKVAGKVGIENSSFGEDLLTMYEAGFFGNLVKDTKSNYVFEPKTYCFGWQWCTTDRMFAKHWAKLPSISGGLNDRMFFLLAPEEPRPSVPYIEPDFKEGAAETHRLIIKATNQGTYEYEDRVYMAAKFKGLDARGLAMAEKLALYFAVDLGLDEIDNECVDRARVLADYRRDVLAYLDPIEAETTQGRDQQQITRELRRNGGKMPYRDLYRDMHANRLGSSRWKFAVDGLIQEGQIAVRAAKAGKGDSQRPKMVYLLKQTD